MAQPIGTDPQETRLAEARFAYSIASTPEQYERAGRELTAAEDAAARHTLRRSFDTPTMWGEEDNS